MASDDFHRVDTFYPTQVLWATVCRTAQGKGDVARRLTRLNLEHILTDLAFMFREILVACEF